MFHWVFKYVDIMNILTEVLYKLLENKELKLNICPT